MEQRDAAELVELLAKHFPGTRLEPGTVQAYTERFAEFKDPELAFEAVRDIINTSEFWPSYSTIRQTYLAKRNRKLDQEQRLALDREGGDVRELPQDVKDFLARHQIGSAYQTPDTPEEEGKAATLPEAEGGACDDCGNNTSRRWRYGKFTVCTLCARLRLRAAAKVGVPPPVQ
jgi:hypothetical protein